MTATQTEPDYAAQLNQAVHRVRELNEQILCTGQKTGLAFLATYEKTLKSVADFQNKAGNMSEAEWLSAIAHAQASFTRELAEGYAATARTPLP